MGRLSKKYSDRFRKDFKKTRDVSSFGQILGKWVKPITFYPTILICQMFTELENMRPNPKNCCWRDG